MTEAIGKILSGDLRVAFFRLYAGLFHIETFTGQFHQRHFLLPRTILLFGGSNENEYFDDAGAFTEHSFFNGGLRAGIFGRSTRYKVAF